MSELKISAHPIHLPDGNWGVKVEGEGAESVKPGDKIKVTSKAGKTWESIVKEIVDTDSYGIKCSVLAKGESPPSATPSPPAADAPTDSGSKPF